MATTASELISFYAKTNLMNETPKVYSAINAVQLAMSQEGIAKTGRNQQQNYAFRGIDAVYAALAPHLAKNGLCVLPRVLSRETSEKQTKLGSPLYFTHLMVEFDFVSMADGSKHTICTVGEAMDSADKSSNKAMSAAYKYACFMAFSIPTEGDNDADAVTHEPAAQPAKTAVSAPVRATPAPVQVPREPLDPAGAGWRDVQVPKFIKKWAGSTLGEMDEKDLLWWAGSYQPKEYPPGSGKISQKDLDFRAALDAAQAELAQPAEQMEGDPNPF